MAAGESQTERPRSKDERKDRGRRREYSFVTPRFWHGMPISVWWRLLRENRFAVGPTRWLMAFFISNFAVFNSTMRLFQERKYGAAADAAEIKQPPIFIIGHWRSGTTLLHELMVRDRRHTSPTTYECFAPNHFLFTEDVITRYTEWVLPTNRPMDNMAAGWARPQEDEFALCNLGVPSPYLTMAFPNRPPAHLDYLDMQGLSDAEIEQWKDALLWFLRRVSLRSPERRIVLKSPPHTGRIKTLHEVFPDALFIHIVRDPFAIVPSTMKLWRELNKFQGLQVAHNRGLEDYVMDCYRRMYGGFERHRGLVDPARFYELHYEDLVRDPVASIRAVYDHFSLGNFDRVQPQVEGYCEETRDYRTNTHKLSPDLRGRIADVWSDYLTRYDYAVSEPL